jgi:hypothetical protein
VVCPSSALLRFACLHVLYGRSFALLVGALAIVRGIAASEEFSAMQSYMKWLFLVSDLVVKASDAAPRWRSPYSTRKPGNDKRIAAATNAIDTNIFNVFNEYS